MAFVFGFINGVVLTALVAIEIYRAKKNKKTEGHEMSDDERMHYERQLKQLENFYNYNGTDRGQIDV